MTGFDEPAKHCVHDTAYPDTQPPLFFELRFCGGHMGVVLPAPCANVIGKVIFIPPKDLARLVRGHFFVAFGFDS
jgi:hypothetical protein